MRIRLFPCDKYVTWGVLAGPPGTAMVTPYLNDSASRGLLERIEAFELDDPKAQLPFTSRLAKEQGWSHAFAGQVVVEYKRLVALGMVAGHPVSPSETVDQAWHLHLVYTKSYWHDLCRDVLGQEFHHFPTTGGREEGSKFDDWYARTLESYQRFFGTAPPATIWPSPEQRKKESGGSGRWIDGSKSIALPFPSWLRPARWIRFLTKH